MIEDINQSRSAETTSHQNVASVEQKKTAHFITLLTVATLANLSVGISAKYIGGKYRCLLVMGITAL